MERKIYGRVFRKDGFWMADMSEMYGHKMTLPVHEAYSCYLYNDSSNNRRCEMEYLYINGSQKVVVKKVL